MISFIKQKSSILLKRLSFILYAGDRDRTGTGIATHGILSPGRLPVPPRQHIKLSHIPKNLFKNVKNDPDGTRTRDLRRDRAAL